MATTGKKHFNSDMAFIQKPAPRKSHNLELEEAALKAKTYWYRGEDLNLHGVAPTST